MTSFEDQGTGPDDARAGHPPATPFATFTAPAMAPVGNFDEEPPFDPDYDVPYAPTSRAAVPYERQWKEPAPEELPERPVASTYSSPEEYVAPDPFRLPQITVVEPGLIVSHAPSSLLQAAELYLSLLAITRSDAETLAAENPFEGASSRPIMDEREVSPAEFVGADGVRLIEAYFDYLWPLRSQATSRSIAHCEGCGEHWYIPAGATKAPSKCTMTAGCEGTVHKAYVRLSPQAIERKRLQKLKRESDPRDVLTDV